MDFENAFVPLDTITIQQYCKSWGLELVVVDPQEYQGMILHSPHLSSYLVVNSNSRCSQHMVQQHHFQWWVCCNSRLVCVVWTKEARPASKVTWFCDLMSLPSLAPVRASLSSNTLHTSLQLQEELLWFFTSTRRDFCYGNKYTHNAKRKRTTTWWPTASYSYCTIFSVQPSQSNITYLVFPFRCRE